MYSFLASIHFIYFILKISRISLPSKMIHKQTYIHTYIHAYICAYTEIKTTSLECVLQFQRIIGHFCEFTRITIIELLVISGSLLEF